MLRYVKGKIRRRTGGWRRQREAVRPARAAITAGIYNTYLGKEKTWNKEDLFNGVMLTDAVVHIISVVVDAPNDTISALCGKLGMVPGINVKTIYGKA